MMNQSFASVIAFVAFSLSITATARADGPAFGPPPTTYPERYVVTPSYVETPDYVHYHAHPTFPGDGVDNWLEGISLMGNLGFEILAPFDADLPPDFRRGANRFGSHRHFRGQRRFQHR